jgi:D-alanine-D-alanine ligase
MKIAVLSTHFDEYNNQEVEEELSVTGYAVRDALKQFGHEAFFMSVDERTFEILRRSQVDFAFNVCERFKGNSLFEPHVAAMLELLGIPYTGSGPLTLAMCINKIRVKEILSQNGIPTPKYQVFYSRNKKLDPELKFPLIVKPSCMDNSIGISTNSVVHNEEDLRKVVGYINRVYNQAALAEEYIEGRELCVGILGNNGNAKVLPISEFMFDNLSDDTPNILSYDAKWNKESEIYQKTPEVCPAQLPKYIEARLKKIALDTYRLLDIRDYGRIDVRLAKDGTPYVLEMNPNPGISADNTIPKAAESLGLSYNEMIHQIFSCACDRYSLKLPSKVAAVEPLKSD